MSVLTFNTGQYHQFTPQGQDVQAQINLDKLSDVTVTSPTNGQVLQYLASGSQWVNTSVDLLITDIDGGTF